MKRMTARYDGRCSECRSDVEERDEIGYDG
jgi:hypothetical protein